MYKKLIYCLVIVTVVTIAFLTNGCQESPIVPTGTNNPLMGDAGNGCDSPNVFCGSPGTIEIQNPCPGTVTTIDLWAGVGNQFAGALVGHVELYPVSGNTWKVKYIFTDPLFEPTSIHFAIACELSGIPQTSKHNPIPGQFPYTFNGPFGSTFEFNITLPTGCSCYYVAAHAGGNLGGLEGFALSLPVGCVTLSNILDGFTTQTPFQGSYKQFTLSNAGSFSGTFLGWCIDLGTDFQLSTYNCAHLYSSYDTILNPWLKTYIEGWRNFDKVNYLINHFHPGQIVQPLDANCNPVGGPDTLTVIDIQKVIWMLLDLGPGALRPEWEALSTPYKRYAILCDVNANGEGFVPNCANGDQIAFIVDPDPLSFPNHNGQPLIATVRCSAAGATAWADGKYGGNFAGPNWATYFKWCPTCP